MKDKFSEVYRDDWERYFEHLRAVANIVLELKNTSVEKILIALYHDSIEDVEATFDIISYVSWSSKIALAVEAISKKDWKEYSEYKEEGKKLRNEDYFGHLESFEKMWSYIKELAEEKNLELTREELIEVTTNIFDVKFADRIHNLSTQWDEDNTEKVKRKIEETKKYFLPVAKEINIDAFNKLNTLILKLEIRLAKFNKKVDNIVKW